MTLHQAIHDLSKKDDRFRYVEWGNDYAPMLSWGPDSHAAENADRVLIDLLSQDDCDEICEMLGYRYTLERVLLQSRYELQPTIYDLGWHIDRRINEYLPTKREAAHAALVYVIEEHLKKLEAK